MNEYLGYSFIKIITEIQPRLSIKQKVWIGPLPTQLKVPTKEHIFPLVWDYLAELIYEKMYIIS